MSSSDRSTYWMGVVEAQQSSGVAIKRWCDSNDVNVHTFQYWRSKLNGRRGSVHASEDLVSLKPAGEAWLEVIPAERSQQLIAEPERKHKKKSAGTSAVLSPVTSISLRVGRVSMDVSYGFDATLLASVLDLLEARC